MKGTISPQMRALLNNTEMTTKLVDDYVNFIMDSMSQQIKEEMLYEYLVNEYKDLSEKELTQQILENYGDEWFDWLYSFREETKRVIERTNQLKRENERLREETEALRSITPEKIAEIVKKSTLPELTQDPTNPPVDAL